MNIQNVFTVLFLICNADKFHGRRLIPAPEKELRLLVKDEGSQHWVETPKIINDELKDHEIVKRQSGLDLTASISNTAALQTAVVNKHNQLRSDEALQENAGLMYKMSGNSDLANFAKSVTNTCYFDHSANAARSNKFGFSYFGENLAVTTAGHASPESLIQSWFNEKSDYTFLTNTCTQGKMCGHYTQIVWGTSKFLGCAVSFCPVMRFTDGSWWANAYFFACNYGPGGNYQGYRPYTNSTTCASCGATCSQGLCDENAAATTTPAVATTTTSSAATTTPAAATTTTTVAPTTTTTTTAAPATTTAAAPTTTTSAAAATTTSVPMIPNCVSMDTNRYCNYYATVYDICSGNNNYLNFALGNCRRTCNLCECRDFVSTCSSYVTMYNICMPGSLNYWYGQSYCRGTCGMC